MKGRMAPKADSARNGGAQRRTRLRDRIVPRCIVGCVAGCTHRAAPRNGHEREDRNGY